MNPRIAIPDHLSPATAAVARDLIARCNAEEGLDLPLDVSSGPTGETLLAYRGDTLIGLATAQGTSDSEICLCVDPDQRRRGVGRALLRAAADLCARRGSRWVLVADAAGFSGTAFATALGGAIVNTEHRLTLDPGAMPAPPAPLPDLVLRPADTRDAAALVAVIAAGFADPPAIVERFVENRLGRPGERFLLAELEGRAAAALRLAANTGWVYITAFAVLPELQGRGLGRRLLRYAIDTLLAESTTRIRIEVEERNAAARALYESSGFFLNSSYHFFSLPEPAPL